MSANTTKPFPANPYNPHCWITGKPEIGKGTWIGAFTLIDGIGGLTIGKGCNISCGVHVYSHSTVRRCVTEGRHAEIDTKATTVGDFVFLGANAVVLMGATIGDHSVVAAGAVVLEDTVVPPYSLVAGVPARVVRDIRGQVDSWSRGGK
jgi:acetyltransferase-like isoleucine patch superfamily enzyme